MNEERSRRILYSWIQPNNRLYALGMLVEEEEREFVS